ncbi:MAG: hypothetical protein JWO37_734 [Acidimicrobiales bacterium]|jgi:hypothetical protein|nr:hypothetical protein [Acidimicrobiales bacterium]
MTGAVAAPPATVAAWGLLARPVDPVAAAGALLGLSRRFAEALAAAVIATSPETVDLLMQMPRLLRSLSVATTTRAERCQGEVRGPILWSETISARGASGGDPELLVCAAPQRAYDTAENRVLVAALHQIVDAARSVERHIGSTGDHGRAARRLTSLGLRYLDHRTLNGIPRRRPNPREVRRVRAGRRARPYAPALAVLDRAVVGLIGSDVAEVADDRTVRQHALLVHVVGELRARGHDVPPLLVRDTTLVGGPVQYRHERHAGPGLTAGVHLDGAVVEADDSVTAAIELAGY